MIFENLLAVDAIIAVPIGAYAHRDQRGPLNCSIYDHGDFCLYCVASSEWDGLAPHVSSGPPAGAA